MHLRRALLLFALVLGLTGLAASIAPPPEREKEPVAPPPAPSPLTAQEQRTLTFRAPAKEEKKPPELRVRPDARILIEVAAREPGQASLPALGRLENATELVPARFELLAPPPGRYDVLFEPTDGTPARVGTLVSAR